MTSSSSLVVAAIDFGTTYSGWAFSFKHDYDADPTRICARQWSGGNHISLKAPTTVLIKPDGKTLESFGYEAETMYADLASQENSSEYEKWYFFRRFKMMLHGKMTFARNVKLEDETQKSLPAKTVFSLVIQYLKDDMLKTTRGQVANLDIKEDEITWVLTVPAIWNDAAKQFMRECAAEAGIKSSNLRIALEPEAASIFCRLIPVEKLIVGNGMTPFKTGSKYMVIDAGGGTVDIAVHEVLPGEKLKEIHKPSGGDWGGTQVDEAYKQLIISLVGNPVFQQFKRECREDYIDMFRDFEVKKREVAPENNKRVTIRLPVKLKEIFENETKEDLCEVIEQTRYAKTIVLTGDKLRVDASVMQNLFNDAIQNTVSHVKTMLSDDRISGISSILMVGGFSESKMLQGAIKSNFPEVNVIVPNEAGLIVLKGAVVFGHTPFSIAQRVSKYTYGVRTSRKFDITMQDKGKLTKYDDGLYCRDLFSKFVEVGQTISLDETTKEHSYTPGTKDKTSLTFDIYASPETSPIYVTDAGCVKLGKVTVNVLDMSVPTNQRSIIVSMTFGGTEIIVKAREKQTGRITEATVDFLG